MPTQAPNPISIDALIVGGGIAGLWTLATLRACGRSAVLVESNALGTGQTVAAQGIIHGGLKYALSGVVGTDAKRIAAMPERWLATLSKPAAPDPDLPKSSLLSPSTWLWGSPSWKGRLGLLGARAGLQTRPEAVQREDQPALLGALNTTCFRVAEPVFNPRLVLQALLESNREAIVKIDGNDALELASCGGRVTEATLREGTHRVTLRPEVLVLCAGKGNEGLRARLGLAENRTQRRPLHMTVVRGALQELYGHCVDGNATRLTITSSPADEKGRRVWQLGGALAEAGTSMEPSQLIEHAKRELTAVLPHVASENLEFSTYRVDRAEAATKGNRRPEDVSVQEDAQGRTLSCWPTKMALAPRLADALLERIPSLHADNEIAERLHAFARPIVAPCPWELLP